MQIILRNKWIIDLFIFHSFKGVTNWHATWAKVSLKRVRTPAVEPSLSCADQTRIRSLKSDNVNVQSPSWRPTSESREEYQIRDRAMSGLGARGWGFEKVFEKSCSPSWLSTGECGCCCGWFEGSCEGGCTFRIPEGELHCGKLSPLNGWRSFSGWRMHT